MAAVMGATGQAPPYLGVQAHGVWFRGKAAPVTGFAADGTWQLQLVCVDRQAYHRVEVWRVTWAGPHARAWWQQHGPSVQPGTALRMTLERVRPHAVRNFAPELHGTVVWCELDAAVRAHAEAAGAQAPAGAPA